MSLEGKLGKSLYGWRWQRYRMAQLRSNPLCQFCYDRGLIVPAVVVDHIVRHQGHTDPLFWDTSNHQSLCKRCHDSIKQQLDRKGWARGHDEQGLPLNGDPQRLAIKK